MVMLGNVLLNKTVNATADGVIVALDGILLPVVALVIVFDLLVIAALIADSETVRSIRWIIGNILIACVVSALGSGLHHIYQVGSEFDANLARSRLTACRVYMPLITLGGSGRVLMATLYAITVFIVVRWWNKPVLAPRNTKYFIIGAMFAWLLSILLSVSSLTTATLAPLCAAMEVTDYTPVYAAWVPFLLLSIFPILFTLLFLVTTVYLIKRQTITENSATKKALLKFGLFLALTQGINASAQIICPAVTLALLHQQRDRSLVIEALIAVFDLSLIPTPILICIFFKPVWHKLRNWLCSCCRKCPVGITAT